MTEDRFDSRNIKEIAIDILDIAQLNLLNVLVGLNPNDVYLRIGKFSNNIDWIIGHCTGHIDFIMNQFYQKSPFMTEEQKLFYAYNAPKELILQKPPQKFGVLLDLFIKITENFINLLLELTEDDFRKRPKNSPPTDLGETLFEIIQKISYHILGHVGQITLIRNLIDKKGASFIAGIYPPYRENVREKCEKWWIENKEKFY
ncbi:MAG: DinB family protein [Asgard group archaeon]|nr:DinB family protein [Asgard group archaeon]